MKIVYILLILGMISPCLAERLAEGELPPIDLYDEEEQITMPKETFENIKKDPIDPDIPDILDYNVP